MRTEVIRLCEEVEVMYKMNAGPPTLIDTKLCLFIRSFNAVY